MLSWRFLYTNPPIPTKHTAAITPTAIPAFFPPFIPPLEASESSPPPVEMLLLKSLSAVGEGEGVGGREGTGAGDGVGVRSEGGGAGGECRGDSTGELAGA